MTSETLRESSREEQTPSNRIVTLEVIQVGALQRIADAVELMAQSYKALINDRDYYKRRFDGELKTAKSLSKSVSALKGVITKMKKENRGKP